MVTSRYKTVVGLREPEEAKLRQELLFTIFSADNNTAVFQGLKLADLSDFILP